MKKLQIVGILALLVVGLVAAGAFATSEDTETEECGCKHGDFEAMKGKWAERKVEMEERRAEMQEVLEQGYDAWYEYVSNLERQPRITELITEENFDTFVAMHEARHGGNLELAQELAEEIGFKKPEGRPGGRMGSGHKMHFRGE